MGKILISILCLLSIGAWGDDTIPIKLSPIYSPEYIHSFTPKFVVNRQTNSFTPFYHSGLSKYVPTIDGETAERLLEYVKSPDLYIHDLEKAEAAMKAKFGSSTVYELRQNLVYAYQALVAYDVENVGRIGLAFDVGLEYLRRIKYDSIQGSVDPMLLILAYRAEHTSNRSTIQRLMDALSEVHPTTTLKFLTNGLNYKTHYRFTILEHLLEEYMKHSKFYSPPDKDALFRVVRRAIDYLYEENLRKPQVEIRTEIYNLAVSAKQIFRDLGAKQAVRYLDTVTAREAAVRQRQDLQAKALEAVVKISQAESDFRARMREIIQSNLTSSVLTASFGSTDVEIGWIRRAITMSGQKVVQLALTKTEHLYTIRLVNAGEFAEQAMRVGLELLLANPYRHGVYYDQQIRVPQVDLSRLDIQAVGTEGLIVRAKASVRCEHPFD